MPSFRVTLDDYCSRPIVAGSEREAINIAIERHFGKRCYSPTSGHRGYFSIVESHSRRLARKIGQGGTFIAQNVWVDTAPVV